MSELTTDEYVFTPIGVVESCFKQNFGIPRQPGLAPSAQGKIWIHPPYNKLEAFEGLSQSSHLWVQFVFHKTTISKPWRPKVRPPRLGGNQSIGVFATRSPNRPNPLGLSVVKNEGLYFEGGKLCINISGLDLLDGTPVLDVKPYIPYVDSVPEAKNTLADQPPNFIPVTFSEVVKIFCEEYEQQNNFNLQKLIGEVLRQDPRPQYQKTVSDRVYGMLLLNMDVQWLYITTKQGVEIWVKDIVKA